MAKERIDLELGGRYSLGDAFKQMNTDLSKAQKSVKDFSKGGGDVLRELSGAFDGELGGAISKVSGMLNKIVQGGIFGAIGAAATAAVGMMVNHFKEAAERAAAFAEVLRAKAVEAAASLSVGIANLALEMRNAEKDAQGFLNALNGKVERAASKQIAQLHLETLQQMADAATNEQKEVIKAQSAMKEAIIKQTASVEKATNEQNAAIEQQKRSAENLERSQSALAMAEAEAAEYSQKNASVLNRIQSLRADEAAGLLPLMRSGKTLNEAYDELAKISQERAALEKQYATVLEGEKKHSEAVESARKLVADAEKANAAQAENVKVADEKLEIATLELEAANRNLAEQKRRAAQQEAALAERQAIRDYEDEAQLEWQHKIEAVCAKAKIEQGELINLLNQLMEEGAEEEEIRTELNKKYNEILERRTKAEKEATENQEKANKDAKSGKSSSPKNATFVKVDIAGIGKGVESALGWQDWQKKHREDQRAVRNAKNEMKIDQAPMTRFLRGDMPKGQASIFMDYLKKKYTPQQIEELGKLAMKTQLLSKKEARQQVSDIKSIAETIKKALAIQ